MFPYKAKKIFIAAFVAITLFLLAGCSKKEKESGDKPVVVATTSMIADIVRNLGGDFVTVHTLIAAGIDPHMYKASEGDVIKLSNANIIFHNGLHLEGKLSDILSKIEKDTKSYAVSADIPSEFLILEEGGEVDPHIWFDPLLWVYAVSKVADGLSEIDPDNELYYRKNEEVYIQQLILLDEENRKSLNRVPEGQRILVTSHDAFSYFGRLYGWEIIGIQGVNTASETSIHNIVNLAKEVVSKNISCVFTETSVSPRTIQALEEAVNASGKTIRIGEPLYSDSLGVTGSGADTYVGMYKANVNSIVSGILNE